MGNFIFVHITIINGISLHGGRNQGSKLFIKILQLSQIRGLSKGLSPNQAIVSTFSLEMYYYIVRSFSKFQTC